jgi:hypothetical protein
MREDETLPEGRELGRLIETRRVRKESHTREEPDHMSSAKESNGSSPPDAIVPYPLGKWTKGWNPNLPQERANRINMKRY